MLTPSDEEGSANSVIVSTLLSSRLTGIERIIMLAADVMCMRLHADECSVWLGGPAHLHLVAGSCRPKRPADAVSVSSSCGSLVGTVMQEGRTVVLDDVERDPWADHPDLVKVRGLHAFIGCPVQIGSDGAGVVALFSEQLARFGERDASLLAFLATVLGLAVHHCSLTTDAYGQWAGLLQSLASGISAIPDHPPVRAIDSYSSSRTIERCPKGIHPVTLEEIQRSLTESGHPLTPADLSRSTGLSVGTVRRYLNYMSTAGTAKRLISYGKVGRPRHVYSASAARAGN